MASGQFVDVYLPPSVPGYPCLVAPVTSTTITVASSGDEGRNRNWQHPLRKVKLPAAQARQWNVIQDLISHFLVLGGPFNSFAFRDPFDFATTGLLAPNEPQASVLQRVTGGDQAFGTGDGLTRSFQLTKTYTRGPATYVRKIGLPLLANLVIWDNAGLVSPTAYSVTRPGGLVTFTAAPLAGHALTWGGLFDIPVRFDADDSLDATVAAYQVGGAAEINLQEARLC
jgi:uncharacterized protein (TIGR02217 family)